jgi:hypothetical protein
LPAAVTEGPQASAGADQAGQFTGAYKRPDGVLYDRPAAHLYGQGSGASSATVTYGLDDTPPRYALLVITGLDDERGAHTPIRLIVNGTVIWEGQSPFANAPKSESDPSGWTPVGWLLGDLSLLHGGDNTVTVENMAPNGQVGRPPWVLLTTATIYYG